VRRGRFPIAVDRPYEGRVARKATHPGFPEDCELVSLKISNGALASAELPNRIKLLEWGENESIKGPVLLDDASFEALTANQRKLGHERVALDFEHNTVPGSPEYERSQEPRKVAAYGTPEILKGDGLYLKDVAWTPAGQSDAKNFCDLSPAVARDKDGRVTFVHSAALVRNGAVHGLTFFNNQKIETMDTLTVAEIAGALGLSDTASKEDVLAKLQAMTKAPEKPKEPGPVTEMSATVDGKIVKLSAADLWSLKCAFEKLSSDQKTAAEEAAKTQKASLIARFAADGKAPLGEDGQALSVETLGQLSVGELKLILANTPVTVPLSARSGQAKEGKANDGLKGLDRVRAAFKFERENKLRVA